MATGIPEQVHKENFSDLHANTGGKKGGAGALNKLGMFAGLLGLAYDMFSDDPHALGMQFSAGNKVNTLYFDVDTEQYFEVTTRGTDKDRNGNEREYSIYNTYSGYRYNKDTKKYEGVNKTGTYKAVRVQSLDQAYQILYGSDQL